MNGLQFSLFFAAILVGYVLIHLRLVRFEAYLREISELKTINDRLSALASAIEKLKIERVEERLDRLHEDLEDLREHAGRSAREIAEAVVRIPTPDRPAALSGSERVRALVETRLIELGYGNLRILTEIPEDGWDQDLAVLVECERNRMPCKGRVLVRSGALRGVEIRPVAASFP
ncbi:MAG: hypothetical protein Fur0037_24310 [Planctomycetota bacterium]